MSEVQVRFSFVFFFSFLKKDRHNAIKILLQKRNAFYAYFASAELIDK